MTSQTVTSSLVQTGLTAHQASLYEALIKSGPLPASKVAMQAHLSRPLAYKILAELEEMGLVEKNDQPASVALFAAAHPLKLKEIADKRFDTAQNAKNALQDTLAKLVSDFNTVSGQPGVRIMEGARGVADVYEDILNEGQPILLMRSYLDDTRPELASLVEKQLREQIRQGIHTRALTPPENVPPTTYKASDTKNLVERRVLPAESFALPAQIIMYAHKVAITSYQDPMITTIIENPAIATTFEVLFESLWQSAGIDDVYSGKTQ